jgi:hypothetical protein
MIAALYVQRNGAYYGIDDVDPWDEKRDARLYDGPYAVVAHPPCSRWCRLAAINEKRWGFMRGEDGGCFQHALETVRRVGGVLEHPAFTDAWKAFGLPRPPRAGGWVQGECGGWVCHVEQSHYGHRARKATWLYAFNVKLPDLRWGPGTASARIGNCFMNAHRTPSDAKPRLTKKEASATPPEFRSVLLAMARSVPTSNAGGQ